MVGFNTGSSMAKTQADIVAENIPAKPAVIEEEIQLPGLCMVHLMTESERMGLFQLALKARSNVTEIELTLGKEYKCVEKQVTTPKSNELHVITVEDVARALELAIQYGGEKCVGFRALVSVDPGGDTGTSKIFLKYVDKEVRGHMYDDEGNIVEEGDEEFNPVITLCSRPI